MDDKLRKYMMVLLDDEIFSKLGKKITKGYRSLRNEMNIFNADDQFETESDLSKEDFKIEKEESDYSEYIQTYKHESS